jgi:TM2 domain-containing membrane protein YozV
MRVCVRVNSATHLYPHPYRLACSAYLLWLFLGLFGAHRFYVGRTGSGLVWLFTFGLFGIGWIIDAFLIPEFVEEHNKQVFNKQMLAAGPGPLFDASGPDYGVG